MRFIHLTILALITTLFIAQCSDEDDPSFIHSGNYQPPKITTTDQSTRHYKGLLDRPDKPVSDTVTQSTISIESDNDNQQESNNNNNFDEILEHPGITINDVTVEESDVAAIFTITLDRKYEYPISVDYSVISQTALSMVDYHPIPDGTLTFDPYEFKKELKITIIDDAVDEIPIKTFTVNLSNPSNNGIIITDTGTCSIINDDVPKISIDDVEVDESDAFAIFTISLSNAGIKPVTVEYITEDITAEVDLDYGAVTAETITFLAGEDSKSITIPILEDNMDEPDTETFWVTLINQSASSVLDDEYMGMGIINDNDDPPKIFINDNVGDEDIGNMSFSITLSNPSYLDISFEYLTANATATSPRDFDAVIDTSVTIQSPNISTSVTVSIIDDNVDESDTEFFGVVLQKISPTASATFGDKTATGTINDNDDIPKIYIDDVTVTESDGTAEFTVTLSNPSDRTVTADYQTEDDTAISPDDYIAIDTTTWSIDPYEISTGISVSIINDEINELISESFKITMDNPTNAIFPLGVFTPGTGTILNEDQPRISIEDETVDEAAGSIDFSISLSNVGLVDVTVDVSTSNGTAFDTEDYDAWTATTVTLTPGELTKTVSVVIIDDNVDESDTEDFYLNLFNQSANAILDDDSATGTITDNDDAPTITLNEPTVAEDTGSITFSVTLSHPSDTAISVDYQSIDDTAVAPDDYTALSNTTINFIPYQTTSEDVDVTIVTDEMDEPDETFSLTLSNNSENSLLPVSNFTGTITDDDPEPTVYIDDNTFLEGSEGGSASITMSNPSYLDISLQYVSSDGTAVAPDDFTALSVTTITFSSGEISQSVPVTVVDDNIDEGTSESFTITGSDLSAGATFAQDVATVTITDDDTTTISIDDVTATEDSETMNFSVTLSNPNKQDITIDFASVNGTAQTADPADYVATSGSLTFSAGETLKNIEVTLVDDIVQEDTEDYSITLTNPDPVISITDDTGTGIGTITDDDDIKISISDETVAEGDGSITFTVTMSSASQADVTMDWTTSDVTATDPSDYTSASGSITFSYPNLSQTIEITIIDDEIFENQEETFNITLSDLNLGSFEDDTGVGTITDDDKPYVTIDDVIVDEIDGAATFTISLSAPYYTDATVDYTTEADTANDGDGDYVATSGTITFSGPEDLSDTVTVTILVDGDSDPEDFKLRLTTNTTTTIASGDDDFGNCHIKTPPEPEVEEYELEINTFKDMDVLANDIDDDTDSITLSAADSPSTEGATVDINPDGVTVRYTPVTDWVGTDTFTYTVSDGKNEVAGTTVSVSISAAELSVSTADSVTVKYKETGDITVTVSNAGTTRATSFNVEGYNTSQWASGGGTCGTTITDDCTVISTFTSPGKTPSTITDTITLSYFNGLETATPITITLSGNGIPNDISVDPIYAGNGDWNDYIKNEGGSDQYSRNGDACVASEAGDPDNCIHGGEKLKVEILNDDDVNDCDDITFTEALNLFDWICDESGKPNNISFFTVGLKKDKSLKDLLEAGPDWKTNIVTINDGNYDILETSEAAWWNNTVVDLSAQGASLSTQGNIYVLDSSDNSNIFNITNDKIAVVLLDGVVLTYGGSATDNCNGSTNRCLLTSNSDFTYIEGIFNGEGGPNDAEHVIYLDGTRFAKLKNVTVQNATTNGIYIDGGTRNMLYDITSTGQNPGNTTDSGIQVENSSQNNYFFNINVSDNIYGIYVQSSTYNTFTKVKATDNNQVAIVLDAGSYNTLAFLTASNSATAGVYSWNTATNNSLSQFIITDTSIGLFFSGSSDYSFSQSVVTNNSSSGIRFDDTSSKNHYFADNLVMGANGASNDVNCTVPGGTGYGLLVSGNYCTKEAPPSDSGLNIVNDVDLTGAFNADWDLYTTSAIYNVNGDGSSDNGTLTFSGGTCTSPITGSDSFTDKQGNLYLINAVEIIGDSLGNDNGLCENNESCIYAPHFGAYQGHGDYEENGTCTSTGSFSSTTIYDYPNYGYAP